MSAQTLGKVEEWVEQLESPRSTIILDRVSADSSTSCSTDSDSHSGNIKRHGSSFLKRMVSKNHRRFVNADFNLDLSYITDRIISMSCPATTATMKMYRNSMGELAKFLDMYHAGRYKVYNLCSELVYDIGLLGGNVVRYPCDDQQPPPLEVLYNFCEDAMEWMNQHPENIIVVHCQAGKGRTGVMVCGLLIFINKCKNAQEAINLFARMRTNNGKGVTIPSQQRYIHYFQFMYNNLAPYNVQGLLIQQVSLTRMGKLLKQSSQDIYLTISCRNNATEMQTVPIVVVKLPHYKQLSEGSCTEQNGIQIMLLNDSVNVIFDYMEVPLVCSGDVKVQLFKGLPSGKHSLFYLWFNAGIEGVVEQKLCFDTQDLDKVSGFAKKNKLALEIQTQPAQDYFNPSCTPGYFFDIADTGNLSLNYQSEFSNFSYKNRIPSFDTHSQNPSIDTCPCRLSSFEYCQSKNSMSFQSSISSMSLKLLSEEAMAINPYMFGRSDSVQKINQRKYSGKRSSKSGYAQLREFNNYSQESCQVVDDILQNLESKWFTQ
eukprot:TRINITY_DN6359_c0_g1_i1.p1 TRINITY_DN6359_c0_g1~~TRINITY_DN6359_c0_g1_i1.p1  ORF type:complete len:552 (+),score=40.02 TRINITY_DN6359_c0_g1_i1:29-1657(+)